MNLIRKAAVSSLIAGSTLAGAAFGVSAFTGTAGAQTSSDSSSTTAPSSESPSADNTQAPNNRPPRGEARQGEAPPSNETALTGEDATKATAAAEAAVPGGTVDRVETDDDGVYEAHVTDANGSHVIVKLDANFAVTSTETAPARGAHDDGGPGGPHGDRSQGSHVANGITETVLTGDEATKATAAAEAAVSGGTVRRAETDAEGAAFEVHMTDSSGKPVTVKLDANFAVTSVENGMK
ncbi:MAG: PepSY domain-containing protein [Acidimicrobiia bacterium]